MEFLYKNRGDGKRKIKPSTDAALLELTNNMAESSDDSDFILDGAETGKDSQDSEDSAASSSSEESLEDEEIEGDNFTTNKKNLTTEQLIELASKNKENFPNLLHKVCGACLGDKSDDLNEIVECDGCGISVHEGCYGISDTASVSSTVSSASTEPWFCEVCRAGVKSPTCQLCPVDGGIFKETDVGQWVHLICALYVPAVAFSAHFAPSYMFPILGLFFYFSWLSLTQPSGAPLLPNRLSQAINHVSSPDSPY